MTIVNLTPHEICIVNEDGTVKRVVPPSGSLARVSATTCQIGMIDDIPVTGTQYSDVVGLPDPQAGVIYVVSALVAQRVNRDDVFVPSETVRDQDGRIIGCKSLGRI